MPLNVEWDGAFISAFTVAELGKYTKGITESYFRTDLHQWACGRRDTEDHCPIFYAETEADARARMFIDLLEKNLIPLER